MEYVDIPSSQLLPDIEAAMKKQMKEVVLPGNKSLEVGKIEWTAEGIRVWMVTEE